MKVRQLKQLAQLSLGDRLEAVSEGLQILADNVEAHLEEREAVWDVAPRASVLLKTLAEEEAGKALLLVDYLRPPEGTPGDQVAAHLARAYSHLARGLYAEYYHTRPATFGEVARFVERERESLYLDGPEGFEWIFRNSIMQRREEAMYVDWVEVEGERSWQSPDAIIELTRPFRPLQPPSCQVLLGMRDGGLLRSTALRRLRDVWAELLLDQDTHWTDCLDANVRFLDRVEGDGVNVPEGVRALVVRNLLFPLTSLDTSKKKVDRRDLEEQRDEAIRNWKPW